MSSGRLPFDAPQDLESRVDARDRDGRARAVDPRFNVALEASAGTGKTRVLVDRYVNLLRAGVDPANILAMTFTRKAAAEMRERILFRLRTAAAAGELTPTRWRELRDRTGDIAISTIDAFCLSLLREFPLEADLDPGFSVADDTQAPQLADEALVRAMRICRGLALEDEHVALVFAQIGDRRVRSGLADLLSRRLVAPDILRRYTARSPASLTIQGAADRAAAGLLGVFAPPDHDDRTGSTGPAEAGPPIDGAAGPHVNRSAALHSFVASGPADPAFMLLVRQLAILDEARCQNRRVAPETVCLALDRAREYFLTRDGRPRARLLHPKSLFPSTAHWMRHRRLVAEAGAGVADLLRRYRQDVNALVARGVWRMFRTAEAEYHRTLEAHAVLDFPELLLRTIRLLGQMEEFARSRYRLESRYHHVLLDEFQDTSRAQWRLVSLLVQSWGEGAGLAAASPLQPSIFVVGDRKQSIYGFRDADVSVLSDAARFLEALRPDGDVRRSISRSFRALPPLLAFVNDVCQDMATAADRDDAFRYEERDRFPVEAAPRDGEALGAVVAEGTDAGAERIAAEVARLLTGRAAIRDPATGVRREARTSDIAVLFRTRDSHRELEAALERHRVPSYVYKGLGFFDADEVRDVVALIRYLAEPASDLRAAAWLRSGFVRLSDEALRRLGPGLAEALASRADDDAPRLDPADGAALALARRASLRWRALVDRVPPSELIDIALRESAYAVEIRGARCRRAWENIKKVRGLVRRVQNKGYATLAGIARHLEQLALGDESNAAIDARDAVSLMTVHAAKGLEFPVVFVANMDKGTGGRRPAIRVAAGDQEAAVSVGDFESESDEDQADREREESKRLLYVAMTRARDRLYLCASTRDGRIQPGRGSLAEVLPGPLVDALERTRSQSRVTWVASSGGTHTLLAGDGSGGDVAARPASIVATEAPPPACDFTPLPPADARGGRSRESPPDAARVRGRLVHRLIERHGLAGGDARVVRQTADGLLRPEEAHVVVDAPAVVDEACDLHAALTGREDLRALLDRGTPFFEVPFAMQSEALARGTIDCLVWTPASPRSGDSGAVAPERVTVLELKTGRPARADRNQADFYRQAAAALFPEAIVEAWLVYRDGVELVQPA
jgi:ATP-dependent helicase/nuclease subunit A